MAVTHDPGCAFAQHKATANHGYCDECCGAWYPCDCDTTPRGVPLEVSPMAPEATGKVFGWDCACVAVSVYDLSGAEEPDHAADCMSDEAVQHREFMANPRPSPDDDPLFGSHANAVLVDHDPLCLLSHPCDVVCCDDDGRHRYSQDNSVKCACCEVVCECDFIAKVREDEANRSPEPPHDQHSYADNLCSYCIGFDAALYAAEEAIRGALGVDERNLHSELTALAAIDALRGES